MWISTYKHKVIIIFYYFSVMMQLLTVETWFISTLFQSWVNGQNRIFIRHALITLLLLIIIM